MQSGSVLMTSAGRMGSWNGKCPSGWARSTSTRRSTATRVTAFRTSTGSRDWLTQHRPPTFLAGIMHGDFHMANLMFRNDGPQVAAIVDWEMCTLGDPLLDFGWLLATWPQDGAVGAVGDVSDLPTRGELIAHYAAAAQRSVEHASWYAVMAAFKLAIVLEGTHARAHAGKAPKSTGDMLHAIAIGLLNNATVFIEKGL